MGLQGDRRQQVLSIAFVKKYLQYAKSRIAPVLTPSAAAWISNVYANLRNDEQSGNVRRTAPLTARTLETLIRLATAYAKARLSQSIEEQDAEAAEAILRYALFKEVMHSRTTSKRRKTKRDQSAGDDEDDDDENAAFDSDDMDQDETDRQPVSYTHLTLPTILRV